MSPCWAREAISAGLSTLQEECAKRGLDWEEVLDQRKREQDRAEQLGLDLKFDTGQAMPEKPGEKPGQEGKPAPAKETANA